MNLPFSARFHLLMVPDNCYSSPLPDLDIFFPVKKEIFFFFYLSQNVLTVESRAEGMGVG